ncbi:MAG: TSUP family transporter [Acidimicrobiia bacterium]
MFTPVEIIIALVVSTIGAALQGVVGFGFGVLSVPILTILDPAFTPVPQLILALPLTISIALRDRRHLDLSGAAWVIAGRFPGALIGALLLGALASRTLDAVIAFIVLGATLVISSGWSIRRTAATEFLAGVSSGITGTVSAIGGPPVALIYHDSPGATIRSTLSTIFIIGLTINLVTLAALGEIHTDDLRAAGILLPGMLVGVTLSGFLAKRFDDQVLRRVVLVTAGMAAVGLAFKVLLAG